jgi:hypothetical protein
VAAVAAAVGVAGVDWSMIHVGENQMPMVARTRTDTVAVVEMALVAVLKEPRGPSRAKALSEHVKGTATHQSGNPEDTLPVSVDTDAE